jgi:hypothetical protein
VLSVLNIDVSKVEDVLKNGGGDARC